MREYKTVQRWLSVGKRGKPYTEQTQTSYVNQMRDFSQILGMNPDEMVERAKTSSTPKEEIFNMQTKIAMGLKESGVAERSIHQKIHALHTFLRANGITITQADMWDFINHGPSWLKRERKVTLQLRRRKTQV